MRRREFIALSGSAAVALLKSRSPRAQQQEKLPTIGFLAPGSAVSYRPYVSAVLRRLSELGWVERRNILIEYRYLEGDLNRTTDIAAEFVRMKVDVILTAGDTQALAAKRAAPAIPIIFAVAGDPVGNGLVASLARPGGKITGLAVVLSETAGKRLELLREVLPPLKRVAIFGNSSNPLVSTERDAALAAAHRLGVDTTEAGFAAPEDIAPSIEALSGHVDALYVCTDPTVNLNRARVNETALAAHLPVVTTFRFFTEAGGLISYGPDDLDMWRKSAELIDKVLRGTKPADIPVEQPTKFELVINLKTAKALGITVPESLLVRADKVIE